MKLTLPAKCKLPAKYFGLPATRAYPMAVIIKGKPKWDKRHAALAKGRAKQQYDRGFLTKTKYNQIVRKAEKVLAMKKARPIKANPKRLKKEPSFMEILLGEKRSARKRRKERERPLNPYTPQDLSMKVVNKFPLRFINAFDPENPSHIAQIKQAIITGYGRKKLKDYAWMYPEHYIDPVVKWVVHDIYYRREKEKPLTPRDRRRNTAVRMSTDFDDPEWKTYKRSSIKRRRATRPRTNPKLDRDSIRELDLYIDNNQHTYNQKEMIFKNFTRKKAAGKFDRSKAPKGFMHLVNSAAKEYIREFGGFGGPPWHEIFGIDERRQLADELTDEFLAKYRSGELDRYVPKKYRKKNTTRRRNTTVPSGSTTGGGYMLAMRGLTEGDYAYRTRPKQAHRDFIPVGFSTETGRDVVDTALVAGKKLNPRKKRRNTSGWYKFKMFSKTGKILGTRIGQGTKTAADKLGKRYLGKKANGRIIQRIVIDGPYKNKPIE